MGVRGEGGGEGGGEGARASLLRLTQQAKPRGIFFFFSDKIACELNIRKCARLPTTAEPLQRRL